MVALVCLLWVGVILLSWLLFCCSCYCGFAYLRIGWVFVVVVCGGFVGLMRLLSF